MYIESTANSRQVENAGMLLQQKGYLKGCFDKSCAKLFERSADMAAGHFFNLKWPWKKVLNHANKK